MTKQKHFFYTQKTVSPGQPSDFVARKKGNKILGSYFIWLLRSIIKRVRTN